MTTQKKIKILFIVSEFYHAGTERFTYELDRAINKSFFDVEILCLLPLGHNKDWKDYYYEKHKSLGTKIFFLNEIDIPSVPTLKQRIARKIFQTSLPDQHKALHDFLDRYDVISFWGEYNYPSLERKLTVKHKARSAIHIQNSIIQKPDVYRNFDKTESFHFVSGFTEPEAAFELQEFKKYQHTFLPLSIRVDERFKKWRFQSSGAIKIGIFTRLALTKPLDPFIYAFHLLHSQLPNTELHIFGTGNPDEEVVGKYVKHLSLEEKVFFRGHHDEIKEKAIEDNVNLVWFHGFHGTPGGFAGFDICNTGIPQIFWNFGGEKNADLSTIFPMYNDLPSFVNKSIKLLTDKTEAEALSEKQFEYLLKNRNIKDHIEKLENLYSTIAKTAEVVSRST